MPGYVDHEKVLGILGICRAQQGGDHMPHTWDCHASDKAGACPIPCASLPAQSDQLRVLLSHRLPEYDERMVIATGWHMRSDSLAG